MPPGEDRGMASRRIIWRDIKWLHTIILEDYGDGKKLVVVVVSEEIVDLRCSTTQY